VCSRSFKLNPVMTLAVGAARSRVLRVWLAPDDFPPRFITG
jgi:hypothetical protein